MTATLFILIDLTTPSNPRPVGEFASRREAHREALCLNLRGYQVKPA